MVKPVDKKLYKNYLQKAEEMLDMAQYALSESKNNAAVMASIQRHGRTRRVLLR